MATQPTRTSVPVTVDAERCIAAKGCRVCIDACPLDLLAIDMTKGVAYMRFDECWYCVPLRRTVRPTRSASTSRTCCARRPPMTSSLDEVARALREDDPTVRRIAVLDVLDAGDDEASVGLLVGALRDVDAEVRAEAARALEGIERDAVVAALATALFDPDDEVRDAAALSLRELKDPAMGMHLLPLAESDDAFVRAAALRALRPLRLAEALQPALTALDAPESAVRREAVGVLGYLQRSEALGTLRIVALHDPDAEGAPRRDGCALVRRRRGDGRDAGRGPR